MSGEQGANLPDDLPLIERLDRIDSRINAVEAQVNEHRRSIAGDVAAIEKRFVEITKGIPAVLESIIVPRVDDLRVTLRSEMRQSVNATLTTFEQAIDEKVSGRVAALEKAIVDQSAIVTALSQRAVESETNVQRLIAAVERLLGDRTNPAPATPRGPSFLELPMPAQSKDAQPFESGFRPRIVKEEEGDRQKRHRRPMTRI